MPKEQIPAFVDWQNTMQSPKMMQIIYNVEKSLYTLSITPSHKIKMPQNLNFFKHYVSTQKVSNFG
jgi:hypothetical protein